MHFKLNMDASIARNLNDDDLTQLQINILESKPVSATRNKYTTQFSNKEIKSKLVSSSSTSFKVQNTSNVLVNELQSPKDSETVDDKVVYEIEFSADTDDKELPEFIEMYPLNKRKCERSNDSYQPALETDKKPRINNVESISCKVKEEREDIEVIEMIDDSDDDVEQTVPPALYSIYEILEQNRLRTALTQLIKKMELATIRNFDMKILIATYEKNGFFTDVEQTLLSETIIKQILLGNSNFILVKSNFTMLANLIEQTFPTKLKAHLNNKNHNVTYESRLHAAFKKYQAIIRETGLKTARKRAPAKIIETVSCNGQKSIRNTTTELTENLSEQEIEFLKSRQERLNMIKTDRKFTVVKYVQENKVLQNKTGYTLIVKDAEFLYPNVKGFVKNFEKVAKNIIQYAKNLYCTDDYVSYLLSNVNDYMTVEHTKLLAILVLPYVLPNATIVRRERRYIQKKTNQTASAVQFIRLFKNIQDETKMYTKLYADDSNFIITLSNIGIKLYGEFHNIHHIAVRLGVTDYMFSDPLEAIEVYIKMFLGINLPYPTYGHHIFDFFEKIAFNLERPSKLDDAIMPYLKIFNK